jgi:hypothetical protein
MASQVQSGPQSTCTAFYNLADATHLRPSPRRITTILALLCACMVLFAATLRVAHSHTTAEQESGHCPICVAIHTGIPAASTPVQVCLHAAPEPVITPTPDAPAKVRVRSLTDRAPPATV